MMGREGIVHAMHYLEHFRIAGVPDAAECHLVLEASLSLCDHLEFQVATHKVDGPSSHLAFLALSLTLWRRHILSPLRNLPRRPIA